MTTPSRPTSVAHIAVVDPHDSGHHFGWACEICASLLRQGYEVTAFFPDPERLRSWLASRWPGVSDRFRAVSHTNVDDVRWPRLGRYLTLTARVAKWLKLRAALKRAYGSREPDLVLFSYVDSYLYRGLHHRLIQRLFPFRWIGLYFGASQRRRPGGALRLRAREQAFRARSCLGVAVLDEGIASSLAKESTKPVWRCPDFCDASLPEHVPPLLDTLRARAGTSPIVACVGTLSRRKGIFTFLRAAQTLVNEPVFFLVAGALAASESHSDAEHQLLLWASHAHNLLFYPRYLQDERHLNAVLSEADYIFMGYEDFWGSSNMHGKAAAFEKLVIASADGCVGERTRTYGLGEVFTAGDPVGLADTIRRLTLDRSYSDGIRCGARFADYREDHSVSKLDDLMASLGSLLRQGPSRRDVSIKSRSESA